MGTSQNKVYFGIKPIKSFGRHPQIKILQKVTFAHWMLNREKTHSDFYIEIHTFWNEKKTPQNFHHSSYNFSEK